MRHKQERAGRKKVSSEPKTNYYCNVIGLNVCSVALCCVLLNVNDFV